MSTFVSWAWLNTATLLLEARTQKMFPTRLRNIFMCPGHKCFVRHNVSCVVKRGNIAVTHAFELCVRTSSFSQGLTVDAKTNQNKILFSLKFLKLDIWAYRICLDNRVKLRPCDGMTSSEGKQTRCKVVNYPRGSYQLSVVFVKWNFHFGRRLTKLSCGTLTQSHWHIVTALTQALERVPMSM